MIPTTALVTPPGDIPVSVTDMKNYLRIDNTVDDTDLEAYISAATQTVEKIIDQKLISQTWDVYFDGFPGYKKNAFMVEGVLDMSIKELYGSSGKIMIPFGPLISLDGFFTYDDADNEYTFAASNYSVDLAGKRGRVSLRTGAVWPATVLRSVNGVKIRVTVGYGTTGDTIPSPILQAIKILTAKLYESRGDSVDNESFKIPPTVFTLLDQYREIKVGGC